MKIYLQTNCKNSRKKGKFTGIRDQIDFIRHPKSSTLKIYIKSAKNHTKIFSFFGCFPHTQFQRSPIVSSNDYFQTPPEGPSPVQSSVGIEMPHPQDYANYLEHAASGDIYHSAAGSQETLQSSQRNMRASMKKK